MKELADENAELNNRIAAGNIERAQP